MKKQIITIGIPAYNEETNIKQLLKSIVAQNESSYSIKSIYVVTDGSTDNTAIVAKEVKDRRIKVLVDGQRKGKAARINEILAMVEGEFVVMFDADVILKNDHIISTLLESFEEDKKVMMVCGNPQPIPSETFIGQSANNLFIADNYVRDNWKDGHNVYSALGLIVALRTSFAKTITLSTKTNGDDMFLYFLCLKKGYLFRRNKKAVVYFQTAQTLMDFVRQGSRQLSAYDEYGKIFGSELVKEEMKRPFRYQMHVPMIQFSRNPYGWFVLKILGIISREKGKRTQSKGKWEGIQSTKKLNVKKLHNSFATRIFRIHFFTF